MSTRVPIPLVSTNAADVTITAWRVAPGAEVAQGDVLLEVTTDKAAFEIEAPTAGTLLAVCAPPRSVVPIGYVVALLGKPGEVDSAVEADNAALVARCQGALSVRDPAVSRIAPQDPRPTPPTAATLPPATVRATPKARRLAAERGLDLEAVAKTTGAAIVTEALLDAFLSRPGA